LAKTESETAEPKGQVKKATGRLYESKEVTELHPEHSQPTKGDENEVRVGGGEERRSVCEDDECPPGCGAVGGVGEGAKRRSSPQRSDRTRQERNLERPAALTQPPATARHRGPEISAPTGRGAWKRTKSSLDRRRVFDRSPNRIF